MRCFPFHRWSKWGKVEEAMFGNLFGMKRGGLVQVRECEKCGKKQIREL